MATRQDVIQEQKPKRTPMGRRNTLTVSGLTDRDTYHYRWFNDTEDRLFRAQEAGYMFVDKSGKAAGDSTVDSARGTTSLMRKGVGIGITAYLMKIPKELWEADQAAKQKEITDLEQTMLKQLVDKSAGRYGTIEVSQAKP